MTPLPDTTDDELPAHEPAAVAQLRARAAGRAVIGLLGNLARRKGVKTFLDVAEQSRARPWLFLLAGELSEGLRKSYPPAELARLDRVLAAPPSNLLILPGRIADERDFNALVQACDIIYAVYDNFANSSGLVTKAATFGKPVLVAPGFCMAEVVRDYGLGLTVDPHAPAVIGAAIATALGEPRAPRLPAPDFARFRRDHAPAALAQALLPLFHLPVPTTS